MIFNKIKGILIFIIVLTLILSACSNPIGTETGSDIDVEPTPTEQVPTATPEPTAEPTVEPTPEPKFICDLTGEAVDSELLAKSRPVAVMIDNQKSARPQSGLINADIVYEFPVEGKITRYLAIYHHLESDKIGPVRSARPYFLDKALEYKAVYVHCGGSEQALLDINTLKVDALNDLKGAPCFWRAKDRSAPHNLYTSFKLIKDVMHSNKLENKQAPKLFNFSEETHDNGGKTISRINISYNKNYLVGYQYKPDTNTFNRLINGVELKDKETSNLVSTKNIIIEMVSTKVIDSEGRLRVGTVGKGRGFYITSGKLIEIEWSKGSRTGKTTYKNLEGEEITLNKGNTWIQLVPEYATVDIKE